MSVKIITDSVSDMPAGMAESLGIKVLPLTVNFEEASYLDGVEISSKEFFEKLISAKKLPTTSQVAPGVFIEAMESAIEDGSEVVVITISSNLSGTYNSAMTAKEAIGSDKVHVINSMSVSFAQGMMVIHAARMARSGSSAGEIIEEINRRIPLQTTYIVFETIDYLAKGGRLSPGKAMIGKVLGIKPILQVKDGRVSPVDKIRVKRKFPKWVMDRLKEDGLDISGKTVGVFSSTNGDERRGFISDMEEMCSFKEVIESEVGPVVGTYSGPGCIAITFNPLD